MNLNGAFENELIDAARKEGVNRFVVGAIIMSGGKVLLLRRPEDDFMGGIYELPSGAVELGETLGAALAREVEEETGLRLEQISQYFGYFDYESASARTTRQFNFLIGISEPFNLRLTEHDDYVWADREELGKRPVSNLTRQTVDFTALEKISGSSPPR